MVAMLIFDDTLASLPERPTRSTAPQRAMATAHAHAAANRSRASAVITVCDGPRRRGAYTSDRLPAGERLGDDFGVVAPKVEAMLPHRLPPPSLASLMASIRMVSMITCTQ